MTSAEGLGSPDPILLAYLRAPARPGMRALALDDLPIVDTPAPAVDPFQWPLPLVSSQADALVDGSLDQDLGDLVCDLCDAVLGERIVWAGHPAVIGLVRGRRWSIARSWGRRPVSAMIAARQRSQWFCLLDHPETPTHLPLWCRVHGCLSVPAATAREASAGKPLRVLPPGYQ